jgi:hypothetical protein
MSQLLAADADQADLRPPAPTVIQTAPISPGQERLLAAELAQPDGTWPGPDAPHRLRPMDTGAVLIEGDLDVAALRRSIEALVRRQAALRTTFRFSRYIPPVQVVTASEPRALTPLPLAPGPGGGPPITDLQVAAGQLPARPTGRTLFSTRLFRLDRHRHVLLLHIHHLISDGWSIGVLYRELSELYSAAVEGREAELLPLPHSFADLAVRMRQERAGPRLASQLGYWARQLHGPWPELRFSPTPAGPGSDIVDDEPVHCSHDLVAALRASGRTAETPGGLAGPMLTALAVVLHGATGERDIRIGMMVASRTTTEAEHLIGYFVNIAVIRLAVDPTTTLGWLVGQANAAVTGALQHQDVPIQDVLAHLRRHSGLGSTPLYQVTLALNTMRQRSLDLAGAVCADVPIERSGPRSAVTVDQRWLLEHRDGGLGGTLTYRTARFPRATIPGYLRDFQRALWATLRPDMVVADLAASFDTRHPGL